MKEQNMKKNLIISLIIFIMLFFNSSYGAEYTETRIYADDATKDDLFGYAVAGDGDKVIVGARSRGDKGINTGAAYLFENIDDTWTQTHKFIPGDGNGYEFSFLAAQWQLMGIMWLLAHPNVKRWLIMVPVRCMCMNIMAQHGPNK